MKNKKRSRFMYILGGFVLLGSLGGFAVITQKQAVKNFVKQHDFLYKPLKKVQGYIQSGGGEQAAPKPKFSAKRDWRLVFDAGQSLGKFDRFWGNLGAESYLQGFIFSPSYEFFQMVKETNRRNPGTFRYFRAHNLYSNGKPPYGEGCNIYHEDEQGNLALNWAIADTVFDTILDCGMKPIVEFGFMPDKLASLPDYRQRWGKGNISAPRDERKWAELVYRTVLHFKERYGEEEIKQWYFEVWNEPDLSLFWQQNPKHPHMGDMEAYYRLYRITAAAAKKACPSIRVGGPVTAGGDVKEFLEAMLLDDEANGAKPPVDFISTHAYGLVGGSANDTRKDGLVGKIKWKARFAAEHDDARVRGAMENLPFLITETGMSGRKVFFNNNRFAAAWAAKLIAGGFFIESALGGAYKPAEFVYWSGEQVTRYFEEQGGLASYLKLNEERVIFKRPIYHAFEALGYLGDERIALKSGSQFGEFLHGVGTKNGAESVTLALYHLDEYKSLETPIDSVNIDLSVESLPFENYEVEAFLVDETHSNPYGYWHNMQRPKRISQEQYETLQAHNKLELLKPRWQEASADRAFRFQYKMQNNSLLVIRLTAKMNSR